MARRRKRGYYLVAGQDLFEEMERLRALGCFAGGELARRRPELRVRRPARKPNRVGFAVPGEWRLSVTAYPDIRLGDAQEILLHELVHLHVGELPGRHRWHGRGFRLALHAAMTEAYGLAVPRPRSIHHGYYAEAIERARGPEQLELGVAA